MQTLDRRDFLLAGTALALPALTHAAMGPNDKFDLLLRNANVLEDRKSVV